MIFQNPENYNYNWTASLDKTGTTSEMLGSYSGFRNDNKKAPPFSPAEGKLLSTGVGRISATQVRDRRLEIQITRAGNNCPPPQPVGQFQF
jgi:hypothetical protein